MKLGLILRKWRINSELTQKSVAAQIGISERILGRIEAGEAMDGETLARVFSWLTEPLPAAVKESSNGAEVKADA